MTAAQRISTFLMFEGNAEEALRFYASLFENSEITSVTRVGPGEAGTEGSVKHASFTLAGHQLMCIDSAVSHNFTFTPSMSLYVDCESADEIRRIYRALEDGGQVLMPLDAYDFAEQFGWVNDRFGVSWQLSLGRSL